LSKEQTDAAIEVALKQGLLVRDEMGGNKGNRHSLTDAGKAALRKAPDSAAAQTPNAVVHEMPKVA
jgi:hypothetical protein